MKPHIIIAMHYMELGGGETALIGLLHALDPNIVDTDLFIYSHQGPLMSYIPKYIHLLPENKYYSMFEKPLIYVLKNGYYKIFFSRLWAKIMAFLYKLNHKTENCTVGIAYAGKYVSKIVPDINNIKYDLAISFMTPHDFVKDHVNAKKKICWIHTDYTKIDIDQKTELSVWSSYDNIISISQEVSKSFKKIFPTLERKLIEIENILPQNIILEKQHQSIDTVDYKINNRLTLCSVGRICYPKNFDSIPYIVEKLKKYNINFHWYIIGPGEHKEIDDTAKKIGVDEFISFLGPKDNPYPYIKKCDIYIQPSRYEGKSIVVREAQVLCKPVIITNYPTAKSQINNGIDGIICDLDNSKIAETIFELYNNNSKTENIINYLRGHDYTLKDEVNKIYKLINI